MNMCNTYKVFETDFNVMFIKKGKDDEEFPPPPTKKKNIAGHFAIRLRLMNVIISITGDKSLYN